MPVGHTTGAISLRCRTAPATTIDRVFSGRLWTAQWKPRITTIAATKRLQLRSCGGCVFCLQQDGLGCLRLPLTVGRAVLSPRAGYPAIDAQATPTASCAYGP